MSLGLSTSSGFSFVAGTPKGVRIIYMERSFDTPSTRGGCVQENRGNEDTMYIARFNFTEYNHIILHSTNWKYHSIFPMPCPVPSDAPLYDHNSPYLRLNSDNRFGNKGGVLL